MNAILVLIICIFTIFQYRSDLPKGKGILTSLVYQLLCKLVDDLRLRILGNKKILNKSQILVKTQPRAYSPFQKLNFGNGSQKTGESRCQAFLLLFSFTGFIHFFPNVLYGIV